MPDDAVIAILTNWRLNNHPKENKGIITASETEEQVGWAFKKDYSGYGCNERVIESFCDPKCQVILKNKNFEKQVVTVLSNQGTAESRHQRGV